MALGIREELVQDNHSRSVRGLVRGKLDAYYNPAIEREISWTDPDLGIEWPLPIDQLQTSQRDLNAPRPTAIADELPFRWHGEPGVVLA